MSKPRVYLAGPMNGLTYDAANDWRVAATRMLKEVGVAAYSPMRAKEFLKGTTLIAGPQDANPFGTTEGIMSRDHNDTIRADALLVNFLGVNKPSLGTAVELGWAYHLHIPVVAVCEDTNPHFQHAMLREAIKFRVESLYEGVQLIQSILLPESVGE